MTGTPLSENLGPFLRRAVTALLFVAAVACGGGEQAASPTAGGLEAADAIVREWVEAERIPGAVLLVSRNGEVELQRAYGAAQAYTYAAGEYGASAAGETRGNALRRLAEAVPMRTDTVFDLASVTKVMATTFAVMLLVDDGALDLDEPIRTYLPDFVGGATGATGAPIGKGEITVRQLLTHRSGLSQWQPIYYSASDPEAAYRFIRDFPLAWEVGAERHYSDLGFMLLGALVEQVAGVSPGELLRERLYGPLGLTATRFRPLVRSDGSTAAGGSDTFAATSHGNPFEHRMVHDPDFGYRIDGDPEAWNGWREYTLVGEVNDGNALHAFGGEAGHAGLFSTAAELQVLLQLLLNGGEYAGVRYVDAETVATFLTPTGDGQALGWQVPDYLPAGSFNHTGFTGTYVAGVPSRGLAIVLLTNRQNVGVDDAGQYPDVGELQRAVARALGGAPR